MDAEDIIYFLAVVAWLIYSAVSRGKKQKEGQRKIAEEKNMRPAEERDIKKTLEELLGKEEHEYAEPETAYDEVETSTEPAYSEAKTYEGEALNPVENYEFGKYKTLEDEAVSENATASQYEKFASLNYNEAAVSNQFPENESPVETVNINEEKKSPALIDFDIEKAIIYSEILKRPAWIR